MNVFAGERIVESYSLGAVGYVKSVRGEQTTIPRASNRDLDFLGEGRVSRTGPQGGIPAP